MRAEPEVPADVVDERPDVGPRGALHGERGLGPREGDRGRTGRLGPASGGSGPPPPSGRQLVELLPVELLGRERGWGLLEGAGVTRHRARVRRPAPGRGDGCGVADRHAVAVVGVGHDTEEEGPFVTLLDVGQERLKASGPPDAEDQEAGRGRVERPSMADAARAEKEASRVHHVVRGHLRRLVDQEEAGRAAVRHPAATSIAGAVPVVTASLRRATGSPRPTRRSLGCGTPRHSGVLRRQSGRRPRGRPPFPLTGVSSGTRPARPPRG